MSKKYLYVVYGGGLPRPYVYGNVKACWETVQKFMDTPYHFRKDKPMLALTYSRFNAILKKENVMLVYPSTHGGNDSISVDTVELNEVY
tara:strand:- start:33 stop:299 length:267 start_codon:yes stop_codon:yes gene_type:complete